MSRPRTSYYYFDVVNHKQAVSVIKSSKPMNCASQPRPNKQPFINTYKVKLAVFFARFTDLG